jgi:hypothetical protein
MKKIKHIHTIQERNPTGERRALFHHLGSLSNRGKRLFLFAVTAT